MTQTDQKHRHFERWLILFTLLAIVVIFAAGPVAQQVRVMLKVRALYGPKNNDQAANALIAMGTKGRVALIRALDTDDSFAWNASELLARALKDDAKAGRDISSVIRAAAEELHAGGKSARHCAIVAAEGWIPGLLSHQTKQEIVRQCLEVKWVVRPEYPLGKGRPRLQASWVRNISDRLHFIGGGFATLDGRQVSKPWTTTGFSVDLPEAVQAVGRHTLGAKIEIALKETDGKQAAADPAWKVHIEPPPVVIDVRDDLPETYLQARVTPELEKLVSKSVTTSSVQSEFGWGFPDREARVRRVQCLCVDPPLPVDLAYTAQWEVVETGKTFELWGGVHLKGRGKGVMLSPPSELMESLAPGRHELTFKVTLKPSFEQAIDDPKVTAYWPLPIELPAIKYQIEVTPKDAAPATPGGTR